MRTKWMLTLRAALLTATCSGALGGCAALTGYPHDPLRSDAAAGPQPGAAANQSKLDQLTSKYFGPNAEDEYNALATDTNPTTATDTKTPTDSKSAADQQSAQDSQAIADKRKRLRDDIVLNRIHIYDMEFSLFERDLSSTNNSISLGTDLTALALNGLGATTGDTATKAALAAASGGVIASNGAVNKDLFYEKTIPAIIAQMQADRLKAEATIFDGLKLSDALYPLQRADLDLDSLNDAGSLNTAIANITQQSNDQKDQTQASIETYRSLPMSHSPTTQKLEAWLAKDKNNLGKLQDWWKSHAPGDLVDGLPFGLLVTGSTNDLENLRAQAIQDKSLGIE